MTKISQSPPVRSPLDRANQSFKDSVLLAATELFTARENPKSHEIRVYRELSRNLIDDTAEDDLVLVARQLAACPAAPGDVLELLAGHSNPLIAYPVLKTAAGLSTDVLGTAVLRGPDSLRRAVAGRPDLPLVLAELIAEVGELPSVRVILERDDLTLSENAASQLCARSDIMENLGELVTARIRMTGELAARHFLNMPAAERREAVATTELKVLVDRANGAAGRSSRGGPPAVVPADVTARALARDAEGTAAALAAALDMSEELAGRIVADKGGEPLMVCLKQLGYGVSAATSIAVALGGPELKLVPLRNLVDLFESLSVAAAEHLTSRWTGRTAINRSTGHQKSDIEREAVKTAARTRSALEHAGKASGPAVRHQPHYQETAKRTATTGTLSDVEAALEAFKKLAS